MSPPLHTHIAILLAAGGSRRLGTPKQLLPWGQELLIQKISNIILETHPILFLIMTGGYHDKMEHALGKMHSYCCYHPQWEDGLASTLKAAFAAVKNHHLDYESVLICACDQPFLTSQHLHQLIRQRPPNGVTLTSYNQLEKGIPLCLDAKIFEKVLRLKDDQGFKQLWATEPAYSKTILQPTLQYDIDTKEDYHALIALKEKHDKGF